MREVFSAAKMGDQNAAEKLRKLGYEIPSSPVRPGVPHSWAMKAILKAQDEEAELYPTQRVSLVFASALKLERIANTVMFFNKDGVFDVEHNQLRVEARRLREEAEEMARPILLGLKKKVENDEPVHPFYLQKVRKLLGWMASHGTPVSLEKEDVVHNRWNIDFSQRDFANEYGDSEAFCDPWDLKEETNPLEEEPEDLGENREHRRLQARVMESIKQELMGEIDSAQRVLDEGLDDPDGKPERILVGEYIHSLAVISYRAYRLLESGKLNKTREAEVTNRAASKVAEVLGVRLPAIPFFTIGEKEEAKWAFELRRIESDRLQRDVRRVYPRLPRDVWRWIQLSIQPEFLEVEEDDVLYDATAYRYWDNIPEETLDTCPLCDGGFVEGEFRVCPLCGGHYYLDSPEAQYLVQVGLDRAIYWDSCREGVEPQKSDHKPKGDWFRTDVALEVTIGKMKEGSRAFVDGAYFDLPVVEVTRARRAS